MKTKKMFLGYWYPRTTLHMSEVYDFLRTGGSPLPLNKQTLEHLHRALDIQDIKMDEDILERIEYLSGSEISVRIYEDGLVVLSTETDEFTAGKSKLDRYFNECYSPAVKYLFSLGAPLPKELAHITAENPLFAIVDKLNEDEAEEFYQQETGRGIEYSLSDERVTVFRSGRIYLIMPQKGFLKPEHLIEMLIFFREFKTQLHHYLNVHRRAWERIDRIAAAPAIKAKDIIGTRDELLELQKSIELVEARIKQMNLYMGTRAKVVSNNNWEEFLTKVLEFRYDNLQHSLDYIGTLWTMTKQHLNSTLAVFQDLTARSTRNSVQTLTFVSTIGVVGGIIANMRMEKAFTFNRQGVMYLMLLLVLAIMFNQAIRYFSQFISYKIKSIKLARKL